MVKVFPVVMITDSTPEQGIHFLGIKPCSDIMHNKSAIIL